MKKYKDYYFLEAKRERYPARSVYKIKEIDSRYALFHPGMRVLDLGAAPGSWSLAASEKIGPAGLVLAVDLQPCAVDFPRQVRFFQEDVFERSALLEQALGENGPFQVVLSDMAPRTTGRRDVDQARSLALCREALDLALAHLAPGGVFVVKIFMGPDVKGYAETLRQHFSRVKACKPKSSRSESFEIFYVAAGHQG